MDYMNLALSRDGILLEERHLKSHRHPSEIIAVEVMHLLGAHGCPVRELARIIVTIGPGSFTGIRVALAFCKGLRAAGSIPVIGISTLDVLAAPFSYLKGWHVCPLVDAKKGEVFTALYRATGDVLECLSGYRAVKPDRVTEIIKSPCVVFGSGLSITADYLAGIDDIMVIPEGYSRVSAAVLLREGLRCQRQSVSELQAIYGRRSEAEIKFGITLVEH